MSYEDIIELRQKVRELKKQFREQLKELGEPIADDPLDEYDVPPDPELEKWQRKFYKRDPIATMVIQGHLLLEEDLNAFIAKVFKNPEAIYGLRFYWKVQLAKAFHPKDYS